MFGAMRRRIVVLVAAALALALAVPVLAVTRNGVTPIAPKPGAKVASGSQPTFRGRATGAGSVWVYVSKSRKTGKNGLIRHEAMIQRAQRDGRSFAVKARFFNYPRFWLNSPGTYYWQAHRVNCSQDGGDCYQEGPVIRFRVA
jgi:hypothetical protein